MEILIVVLIAIAVITAVVLGHRAARRRIEALTALAAKLGLGFTEERDRALAERLNFLNKLDQGSNRYVHNRLGGVWQGHEVMAFDFHYETYSHSRKGGRQTHHHHLSVFTLVLPRPFPELLISPEGLFSKLAQAFGYDDIDFESAEFSGAFCVRSRDKKFAYDICHPLMMEYLLAHRDLAVEIEGNVLALVFGSRLDVAQIEPRLQQLVAIRRLMPDYLFTKA